MNLKSSYQKIMFKLKEMATWSGFSKRNLVMLSISKDLVVTRHAKDRADEFGLTIIELTAMFWRSVEEKRPPGARPDPEWRRTLFRRHGTYVMVVGLKFVIIVMVN